MYNGLSGQRASEFILYLGPQKGPLPSRNICEHHGLNCAKGTAEILSLQTSKERGNR